MNEGEIYYLSKPDDRSRKTVIERGHGFFWVRIDGWRYRSVATGKVCMFYYSELTRVKQEQNDDDLR